MINVLKVLEIVDGFCKSEFKSYNLEAPTKRIHKVHLAPGAECMLEV